MTSFLKEVAEFEALEAQEFKSAEIKLRGDLGEMYDAEVRLANNRLRELPGDERAKIINGRTQDGRSLLNDPDTVQRLAREARPNLSREEIERTMRTNPRAYFSDEAMQARLRDLLATADGAASAPGPQPAAAVKRPMESTGRYFDARKSGSNPWARAAWKASQTKAST